MIDDVYIQAKHPRPKFSLFVLSILAVLVSFMQFYKLGEWPWDHDEVASLIELGLLHTDASIPEHSQLRRLPKLLPVWYHTQRFMLQFFPHNEFGTRVLSALCGTLIVVLACLLAMRWRGVRYAIALLILVGGSQYFVWLVQQNRFYTMALLFFTLTLACIWSPTGHKKTCALGTALCSALAVLSHNLLLVAFGIAFSAAAISSWRAWVPSYVLVRTGLAVCTGGLLYATYLRPIMQGWVSGDTGGTSPLVSFAAQLGIPTGALAMFGVVVAWIHRRTHPEMLWWTLLLAGGGLFIAVAPWLMPAWNPRYGILFVLPFWIIAAYGVEELAVHLKHPALYGALYGCIALLLAPKLLSHYQDGSRHDFRTSAAIVASLGTSQQTVYCNWPITLEYYLRPFGRWTVHNWHAGVHTSRDGFFVVLASNAFDPRLTLLGFQSEIVSEIATRRFDEQSHVVRIYKVTPLATTLGTAGVPPQ